LDFKATLPQTLAVDLQYQSVVINQKDVRHWTNLPGASRPSAWKADQPINAPLYHMPGDCQQPKDPPIVAAKAANLALAEDCCA